MQIDSLLRGMFSVTWEKARRNAAVELLEHPVTGTLLPKEAFEAEFRAVLEEFDGTTATDYFDCFFTSCDVCTYAWRFRDEDARADFTDIAIEHGLLPSLKEYHEGESKSEKLRRIVPRDVHRGGSIARPHKGEKRKKAKSRSEQLLATFEKLKSKIDDESTGEEERTVLQAKLARVIVLMDQTA